MNLKNHTFKTNTFLLLAFVFVEINVSRSVILIIEDLTTCLDRLLFQIMFHTEKSSFNYRNIRLVKIYLYFIGVHIMCNQLSLNYCLHYSTFTCPRHCPNIFYFFEKLKYVEVLLLCMDMNNQIC